MPRCNLSQDFLENLLQGKPNKSSQYADKELVGFLLEYRQSGKGTWYFRYQNKEGNKSYFRIGSTSNMNAIRAREEAYHINAIIFSGRDPKQTGSRVSSRKLSRLNVKTFVLERYIPHAKLKKRSWELDKRVFEKYFFPQFGACIIGEISRLELSSWKDDLVTNGLATNTCNRIFSVIKSLFNCAVRWGVIQNSQNPCQYIARFPENIPQTRYLDREEMQKVFLELKTVKSIGAKALQLLLLTGARKTEIMTARWEYVNFKTRILTVPLSKSGKARYIPLSDEALDIISTLPQACSSPWLFPTHNAEKHITSLYHTWDNLRRKLGLQDVRIHDLRHSFASLLVTSGSSLYEVQKILGHHDPKVTMRYAHFAHDTLVDTANRAGKNILNKQTYNKKKNKEEC